MFTTVSGKIQDLYRELFKPNPTYIGIDGYSKYELFDADTKELVAVSEAKNRILTRGFTWHVKRIANSTTEVITNIGIGNSDTAVALNDTDLIGSTSLWKAAGTPTEGAKTVTVTAALTTSEGNFTAREMGIRVTGNVLIHRSTITPRIKTDQQTGQLTWILTLTEPGV